MTRDDALKGPQWFTSSYSNDQGGQCVEAAHMGNGTARQMWVRDSKDPDGPLFKFSAVAWTNFVRSTGEGEFKDPSA